MHIGSNSETAKHMPYQPYLSRNQSRLSELDLIPRNPTLRRHRRLAFPQIEANITDLTIIARPLSHLPQPRPCESSTHRIPLTVRECREKPPWYWHFAASKLKSDVPGFEGYLNEFGV